MSSQHPRQHTLPDGLFRGLSSFQELEARIARLPVVVGAVPPDSPASHVPLIELPVWKKVALAKVKMPEL
jgi:hypothetical protein